MSFTEAVRQHYIEAIKDYYGKAKAAKILNADGEQLDKRIDLSYLIDCLESVIDDLVTDLEDNLDLESEGE